MATVVRINVVGRFMAQQTNTVFHYRLDGSPTGDVVVAAHDAFYNYVISVAGNRSMMAVYAICLTSDWRGIFMQTTRVSINPNALRFLRRDISTVVGSLPPPTLPPQVATVVRRRTLVPKRWGRGRIYLPAIPQASVNNGVIDGAVYGVNLQDLVDAMNQPIVGGSPAMTFRPCLIRSGIFDIDGNPTSTDITSSDYDTTVRTQRRRELGVGV